MPLPEAAEAEKTELFLFVWDKFSPDYTDVLAVAIAETVEQAQKLINQSLRYEVKVYPVGEDSWSTNTPETLIAFGGPAPLEPGKTYYWSVKCPTEGAESRLVCKGVVRIATEQDARQASALRELSKDADEAVLALAAIWFVDREMLPEAKEIAERLVEKNPKEPAYHKMLAGLYGRLGQEEGARDPPSRLIELSHRSQPVCGIRANPPFLRGRLGVRGWPLRPLHKSRQTV